METANAIPQDENSLSSPQQPETPTTISNSQESSPQPSTSLSPSSTTTVNVQEDLALVDASPETSSQVPEQTLPSSSSNLPLENDVVSHSPQESSSSIPNASSSAAVAVVASSPDHHQTSSSSTIQTVSPERLQEEQLKYCGTMLKSLKKLRDASPFLQPVDPIALGIPDYTIIIKTPMDLSTIEQKLASSQYPNAEAFLDDIKLMLSNCFTYNPPETVVHKMGRSVERQVENLVKKMPNEETISKALASSTSLSSGVGATAGGEKKRKSSTLPGAASQAKKRSTSSVGSFSPSASSSTNALDGVSGGASTPKIASGRRSASKKASSSTSAAGLKGEDLKNSLAIWREVTKKSTLVWPFMQPVDPIALGIPDYFTVIREPMDFGTVKKRIDAGEYGNFGEFEREMRLVFTNCYTYNAPDSDVVSLAKQVEAIFEAKLAAVISKSRTFSAATAVSSTPSSMAGGVSSSAVGGGYDSAAVGGGGGGAAAEDSGDDSDSEKMHSLKQQLASIKAQIAAIVHKRKMRKGTSSTAGVVSSGATTGKAKTASTSSLPKERKKSAGKTELTFEEKRQLSYDINFLPPEKLTDVVEIIRESIPSLKSSEEEIELDIDSLDVKTQRKLQAFVMKHQQEAAASKGGQPSSVPVNKVKERFSDTSDDSDSD